MGNYFDKFDGDKPAGGGNFFDQFDESPAGATPSAADYLKGAASGVGGLVSGIGYLAESVGADRVGGNLRLAGDTAQKAFLGSMTPAGQRAAQSQVFEDDPNSALPKLGDRWGQALAMGAAQSAPSMVAAAIPGGIAAAGLRGAAGMAASRGIGGALAPLAAGTAAPVGGWATNFAGNLAARAPAALGFGAAEGAVAGASNAAQWKSDIEQRSEADLDAMPGYSALKALVGPGEARRQIAEQGAADIMARTTLATGGIGALTGGGALGSAFQRVTTGAKGGIAGAIGRDAAKEAGQEIPQSGGERAIQNIATRDYLDPNQPVSQGVVADALSGGAIGGLIGGVTGGASHLAKGPLQKAVEASSATVPPSPQPPAYTPPQSTFSEIARRTAVKTPQLREDQNTPADASVRDLVQVRDASATSDFQSIEGEPESVRKARIGYEAAKRAVGNATDRDRESWQRFINEYKRLSGTPASQLDVTSFSNVNFPSPVSWPDFVVQENSKTNNIQVDVKYALQQLANNADVDLQRPVTYSGEFANGKTGTVTVFVPKSSHEKRDYKKIAIAKDSDGKEFAMQFDPRAPLGFVFSRIGANHGGYFYTPQVHPARLSQKNAQQSNTPAAPGLSRSPVPAAASSLPTNQAEPAGVPVSQQQQGLASSGNQTEVAKPAEPGQQAQPAAVSGAAGAVGNTGTQPAPAPAPIEHGINLQNRDRSRAASVIQMSEIARNPDYMRLGPSRTPDSGAPMVFAVGDDQSRIPATNFGNGDVAVMSDGQRVPFRYAVVGANQVEPSNFADGRANPAFAAGQPGTIKALNNGRTAGLRAAYEIGSAGTYQTELAKDLANVGISPDALQATPNPILVRVYSDTANTAGMAAKSQSQGLGMSPAELARQDAPLLDSSVLELFRPGDVAAADNRDFVRAFVGRLQQSGQDIAGMMTDAGTLSPMGRQRIQAALMQAAYGDADLVAELFDSIDTDIKAIGEALKAVAGAWANMRDSAKLGAIAPEVDITGNLVAAVRLIQKARRDGASLFDLVNQRDIETGDAVSDLTVEALRLFYTGKFLTRAVGKEKLVSDLEKYLSLASATSAGADMFGNRTSAADLLADITKGRADEGIQGERKPAGVPPAGPGSGGAGRGGPGRRSASGGNPAAQGGGRGGSQGEGGQEAVIVPPAAPAATLSYEEFSKQYRDAFANAMRYSPNEVGAAVFTERMAKLADDYPEFLARLEAEEEGKARPALALRGQTPEEVAAAEAEAKAAADKEAKARQDAEKARKDAEDRAEIKRRPDGAAQSFELGGDAMANLSGQGDMFGGPPAAAAPSREPTSNAGELPPEADAASDDLGALFDAELEAAFSKPKEEGNEPGSVRNSQRDREAADAQQGDEGALSDERGRESATPGGGVPVPDANSRGGRPGGSGVSGVGAASGGERGDQPVPGTKRPAGVEKLPAGDNQRQGSAAVRPGGVAASGGESAAAVGGPAGGAVGPRSASAAGKSAAKNAGLALSDVAKGLNALFKPKPGQLGMGLPFDEDTYAAAKPYFQAGLEHFRQAGADIVEMVRALIAALRDQFGMDKDTIAAMKPYVLRYISDVQAGRDAIEETNQQQPPKDKLQQQRDAESIEVIVGDKANIDATLPFLTDGQREDVLFAEKRWSKPDGYGVLFTNGTGTGKTFLALGTIKRLAKRGKGNGIVVVPNEAVMNEWVKSAPALGLQIKPLTDTKDSGSGIAITTYANFGQNDEIAKRDYDFVAIDEAHLLMLGKDAEPTKALDALRAVSLHPDGVLQRAEMQNRELVDRIKATSDQLTSISRMMNNPDIMDQMYSAYRAEADGLEKKLAADRAKWKAVLEAVESDVMARQGEKRTRAIFLSATPFAYEPSIQWGEGYLYEFPQVSGRGYNAPSGYQKFMMQHFGWRMRNGKLNKPPAEVDSDLMQRQFNTWLRKEGVLSARMLDVDHDYERKFILIQGGVGQTIDDGLRWLRETDNGRYWSLYHAINEQFDYLTRSRLLEAIKARAAIPYIKKHHALGRKVVVFYDFNSGGGINVFNLSEQLQRHEAAERKPDYDLEKDGAVVPVRGQGKVGIRDIKYEKVLPSQLIKEFMAARPELQAIDFSQYGSPLTTLLEAFPGAGVYNGMSQYKKMRVQSIRDFNDDAKPEANLLLVQKAANAGWSGHDTTGKHGRILINLGLPVAPIEAIQEEGRIYRVGQKSDANFQYFNTGTNWERYAFGSKIARRAGTAENLAMGEQARGLREAFIQAFENSDPDYEPGAADGRGGKAGDRDLVGAITEWDRARSLYFAQQKRTSRTKAAEGVDYYATPEPLGLKMVEWAGILTGESVLEPSAGHGAIARWFPEKIDRTVIEPSLELASRLTLATDAKLINERFEGHDTINKYDAIVMNPPFGVGGKTAIEHLDKAFRHLTDGGRVVALIPEGPAANKRFDDWLYGDKQVKAKPVTSNLGTFGAVFLGDTATVEVSGLAGIAGGVLGASTVTGKVTGFREGKLFVQREGDAWATGYRPDQIRAVQPTGARTVTVQSAPAAYLRASIGLPGVTFERAGTAVKTRVVIIDKITEQSRLKGLRTQDSREIEAASIKELFERIENMSVVGRSLPADKARVQKQEADRDFAKAANAGKMDDAGIVQPSGAPATVESIQEPEKPGDPRKLLTDAPRVEHVTKAGKTIFGVVAKRLTKDQARSIDPYMWAKDGGFFIRMAHVVRPPNVVEQERAVYNVNEPDGITGDLFRGATSDLFAGTDHALPAAARTNLPGERAAPTRAARPAPGPAARVLAVRQAQDAPGLYHVSTQLVTVGERELPVERIRTTEDAAKAFAYLPRWAVEHYDAIVTDKDGKPLAVIGGFKGGTTQTSVSPATVVAELSRIDGAKNLWAAHNHPSGLAVLSNADRNLDREFATILEGAGVSYHGLFALVGARAGVVKYDHTIFGAGQAKQSRKGLLRIPMVERELTDRREDVDRVLGPPSAKDLVSKIAGETPGIVFLDAQNGIVAFTPFRGDEMGSLRRDGRLMRLFRSASQANAVSAVVANPNGEIQPDQIANLVNALGNIEVSTHDVIGYSTTEPSSAITSMAEVGSMPSRGIGSKVVFSAASTVVAASPSDRAIYSMAAEGKSADEILSFISKSSRRPFNRVLAAALRRAGLVSSITLDTAARFGKQQGAARYAAAYNARTDTVALFTYRDAERHVLHELVHAATMKAIAGKGPAAVRMLALFRHVQKSGRLDGQYGMTDVDEFVAEAFSNPRFQEALRGIAAPAGSTLKSAWQWFVRIVARIVGIRTQPSETALDRALTVGAQLMNENAALAGGRDAGGDTRYAIAWHGTPHVWPPEPGFPHGRPRLDKMGSGEGAQAYGWGWYSAESQGVASIYKTAPGAAFKVKGKTYGQLQNEWFDLSKPERRALTALADSAGNASEALANLEDQMSPDSRAAAALLKQWIESGAVEKTGGTLYQLDIPDDVMPKLLDWDKPLSEQPPEVRNYLRGAEITNRSGQDLLQMDPTGEAIVSALGRDNGASEYLASLGIPGLRYLDGSSRNANTTLGDVAIARLGKENTAPVKRNSDGIGGYPKQFSNIVAATSFLEKLNGGINRPFGALGGGMNSATLKNQSDGLVANSKFLTDLLESGAFRSHGLSGIDAPTQRMVLARVIAVLKDRKILDSVIKSVPVDMVDMLRTEQLTPEMLLHDKAMLFKLNIPVGNNSVSVSVDAAGAVVAATARQAAKHILVPFYDAGGFFDIGPAVITGRKHGELQAGKEHITDSIYDQLDKASFNFVIWDQKVLDRIALLERNGEALDAIRAADEMRFSFDAGQPFDGREVATTPLKPGTTTLMVDGTERPALNSNGKPIHWSEEGIRNFWRWFGDSKVVDAQGRPIVLFHGSTADFGADGAPVAFDFGRTADEDLSSGKGAYLTTSKEAASRYAYGISWGNGGESDAPNVMPVYVRIEAPFSKTATYRIEDFESVLPERIVDGARNDANPSENFLEETRQLIDDLQSRLEDLQSGYLNNEIADEYRIDESDYDNEDDYQAAIEEAIEREVGDAERTIERYEGEIERAWADAKERYSNTRLSGDEIWTAIKKDLPEYSDWKNERQLIGGDSASIETDTEVARILFDAFGFDGVKRTDKFPIKTQHTVYIANNFQAQIKSSTGNTGAFSPDDPDIRFNLATDWQQSPVAQEVAKAFKAAARSDAALSWLNPVQTQYHKAERLAQQGKFGFKRVFDIGQRFLSDISRFAVMAENSAPTLFHQIRSIADAKQAAGAALRGDFGKQRNADIRAIAAPLYEGTLYGGGNPMAGMVWSDAQLRSRFGLTDKQIVLYHEAREAVKVSMDEMAKSLIARHAKREKVAADTSGSLQDVAEVVRDTLTLRADVLADEAQAEHDDTMQQVKDLREAGGQDRRAADMESEAKAKLESQKAEVARIRATVADVQAIADKAQKLQDAGYFPLMRFGRHTVTARDADGKVRHFSMHDGIPLVPRSGQAQANKLADALREEHPDWDVTTGLMNPEKYKLYQGMNVDALQLFADHLDDETKQTYQEIIRLATNERSVLRRMLKREGTPGFDRDVRRTLASFILSNARYTSSAYHLADMARAAEQAEEDGGDVGAEAVKLYDYVTKPQEEAAKLRGFLFFNFMGGSIAAAMVNATQVPMMTFPRLAQYEDAGKLAARLARAAKMAAGNPQDVAGEIGAALRRAEEAGITAPHQIYEMTATAANNIFAGSMGGSALLRAWGAPFAMAESFNRRTTFIAAWQIGQGMTANQLRDAGAANAFEFAEKMVQETQGIYNRGNRVNLGRGAIGATVMTFKQFSVMYLEMFSRLPPKQKAIMAGMLILAAGAGGLPFAEDIEDIIDTIGQWLGYRTNTRRTIRRGLSAVAGQLAADIAMNGVLSQVGVDLHSRLGLHNILPGSALLKPSTTDKGREFQDLLGPAASVVAAMGQALQDLATGRPDKAALDMAPVAVQNAVKGSAMLATGRAADARGKPTIPVSPAEAAAKGIGFNPKSVAEYGTTKRDIMQDERLIDVTRERFTAAIVDAILADDQDARREALQDVVDWNKRNPDARIAINPAAIRRRVADMRAEGPARVLKSLSPSLRQQARQEFADAQR